jgi:ammonium transporter, Amt family
MRNRSVSKGGRLTYPEKFSRLTARLRDPQWRRYGALLLAGKALGIALLFGIIVGGPTLVRDASDLFGTVVHAQQNAPAPAEVATVPPAAAPVDHYKTATGGDIINPVNTAWVL